jgi:hypothetical protein
MPAQRSNNTFNGGLNLDFDLMTIGKNSYILSENGRIIYTDQSSLSWVNAKGNTAACTIQSGVAGNFNPVGYAVINNLLILFIVDDTETTSEIALITFDENGVQNAYQTLISDAGFADKFNFKKKNLIEAHGFYENEQCLRVYWVDGVEDDSNPSRAFTFKFDGGDINLATNYSAVTVSPHNADEQADWLMGIIKYKQTINGSIPAGQYLYTYRLLTADGYATPWYPPTIPLFVTQDPIQPTNWNEYEMEGTETFVNTGKGNRLEIKGIDDRYQEIEVAYVHYIANSDPFEANIFVRTGITSNTMEFDHKSNSGEPINPLEIPARRISFVGVKTLEVKDNVLYKGNTNERLFRLTEAEQEEVLSGITIEPKFKLMRSDEEELITTNPPPTDFSIATFGQEPLTHQVPKTGTATKKLNQSHSEVYTINNDYVNYKGTQVSHIYTGFWREETARLGIVFFDEVGNTSFTYHLADIEVDPQYGDSLNWQRLKADGTIQNGSFTYTETFRATSNDTEGEDAVLDGDTAAGALSRLRILGFEVSGINITNIKSRIRGFMIVRAERDPQIIGQGIITPTAREQNYTVPMPTPTQTWTGTSGLTPMIPSDNGGTIHIASKNQSTEFYHLEKDTAASETDNLFKLRPNTSLLYMPDVDFDIANYPTVQPIDRIKLVGQCTQKDMPGASDPRLRQYMEYNNYVVQKLEHTDCTFHTTADLPYPQLGSDCTIEQMELIDYGGTPGGKLENYQGTLDFYNACGMQVSHINGADLEGYWHQGLNGSLRDVYGHGKNNTIFLFHNNFGLAGAPIAYDDRSDKSLATYFIANYKRPNSSPYGGLTPTSIEQTRFISTGHFQPVNNPSIPDPDIVNEIEVFGGDCYLDYHGFAKMYGIMLDKTFLSQNAYSDYGLGMVFPLESSIHYSLRQANNIGNGNPMYPDIGLKPAASFYGEDMSSTPWAENGLFLSWNYTGNDYGVTVVAESNVEEFNINGVLFLQAILKEFFGVFSRFKDVDKYPVRWRYSEAKISGEFVDQFRIYLANNFNDLKGTYGPITSSKYIFNQIYSFQHNAFGRLRAFDRGALVNQNLGNLFTGLGDELDGIDYISETVGNQHQWSLVSSGKALYWIDGYKKTIMRFAQDGVVSLSDQRQVNRFARENIPALNLQDTPLEGVGIVSVFDFDNSEVIFSFIDDRNPIPRFKTKNIIYNETTDKFVDTPTFEVRNAIMFNDYVYYFNTDVANTLWLHNSGERGNYMGNVEDAVITIVVNDAPYVAKVWDSIRMNINDGVLNTLTRIQMETQEQNETIIDIPTDDRYRYLEQVMRGPLRNVLQNDRMRGKWIKLTFVFDNSLNEKVIFTNLMTLFRTSNRM